MTKVTKLEAFCRIAESNQEAVDTGLLEAAATVWEFNIADMTALAAEIRELQRRAAMMTAPGVDIDAISTKAEHERMSVAINGSVDVVLEDARVVIPESECGTPFTYRFDGLKVRVTGKLPRIDARPSFTGRCTPPSPSSNAIPDADGWIEWRGGECPVHLGTIVDVRHRDGNEYFGTRVGVRLSDVRDGYAQDWSHDGSYGDIVAYRVVK